MFDWSVQIINGPDNQSKFQLFSLFGMFFGRHACWALGGTPTWRLHTGLCKICAKYFDKQLKIGKTSRPKNLRSVLIIYLLQRYYFLNLLIERFPNCCFFNCVTVLSIWRLQQVFWCLSIVPSGRFLWWPVLPICWELAQILTVTDMFNWQLRWFLR